MSKEITLLNSDVVVKIDAAVAEVFGATAMQGFEKAHVVAKAIGTLKELLTPEYMAPIMALQGSRLGFRTDKDKNKDGTTGPGYPIEVVKNCLIEAVLIGLQPTGNQFNIIAGNTYGTKEGIGAVLNRKDFFPNLKKSIIVGLPRINNDKTSAAFDVHIEWTINGVERKETVPIPIKIDAYTSVDSMVGKATRKARAWLLGEITGVEITDAEVEDGHATVVGSTRNNNSKTGVDKERERLITLIRGAKTIQELEGYKSTLPDDPDMYSIYELKLEELKTKK